MLDVENVISMTIFSAGAAELEVMNILRMEGNPEWLRSQLVLVGQLLLDKNYFFLVTNNFLKIIFVQAA